MCGGSVDATGGESICASNLCVAIWSSARHSSWRQPTPFRDPNLQVTYHGPGQLVVYPILDLKRFKQDLHWFMRVLEEAIIQCVALD